MSIRDWIDRMRYSRSLAPEEILASRELEQIRMDLERASTILEYQRLGMATTTAGTLGEAQMTGLGAMISDTRTWTADRSNGLGLRREPAAQLNLMKE